jgi:cytochrome c-type biogenesis protein CcsB
MIFAALGASVLAALGYLVAVVARRKSVAMVALVILIVGIVAISVAIVARGVETGHAPLSNFYESLLAFSWGIALGGVIAQAAFGRVGMAGLAAAAAAVVIALAQFTVGPESVGLMPALKSAWLTVHVSAYMVGYGACGVAALADLVCLVLSIRVRSGEESKAVAVDYDRASQALVSLAYPLLTIGLITGAIWAKQAWGRYWGWDPKETWGLITWLSYGLYFHATITFKGFRVSGETALRNVRVRSLLRLVAFAILLFTFLGLNILPSADKSMHLYK